MRHPYGQGLMLALAAVASLVLSGPPDILSAYMLPGAWLTGEKITIPFYHAALAAALVPGALLASLPARIRQRGATHPPVRLQHCAVCFAGGFCMLAACLIAGGGDGWMFSGVMQGSLSALSFALTALVTGSATHLLLQRRRRA